MVSIVMKSAQTTAKPVGKCLVATFHAAIPPLVWQFDLEKNHNFTVSVQGEDGKWDLGVTEPRGAFTPIAHFDDRMDAEEAFAVIEKAMMRTRGSSNMWMGRVRGALLTALFLLLGIVVLNLVFGGKAADKLETAVNATAVTASGATKPAEIENGVPMSADDVLKMPRE